MLRARQMTLLAGAGAVVLWGCSGDLQPGSPMDEPGGAGGAAGGAGTGGAAGAAGSPAHHVSGPCLAPAADVALARIQTGVLGSWLGTAIAPTGWTWSNATVEFTFFCDGVYHARCLVADGVAVESADSCGALYYDSGADNPQKTYEIYDMRSDGKATGHIVVWFGVSNTTTRDDLEAIDLAASRDRLTFDFMHLGQYGPIHYDLLRAP